jgi:hypothetical protein
MTDLITRARREWLEVHKSPEGAPDGEAWHYTLPCPPEVVSALLDVLEKLNEFDVRMSHGGREALRAEAAIAKALEEK